MLTLVPDNKHRSELEFPGGSGGFTAEPVVWFTGRILILPVREL